MEISQLIASLQKQVYAYSPKLASGLLVLVVGFYLASFFSNQIKRSLFKSEIDEELSHFLVKITKVTLQITVVISALSILGIKTSSFLAVLGSAGLAIGLALQGSLSNFAGGVIILVLKPFGLEDFIEYSGHLGTVDSINIFTTKIRTPDNKLVIIPNGPLANGVIINYSSHDTRRNEWIIGIAYKDDISKAKRIVSDYILSHEKILKDPEPFIAVKELADSSVNIVIRAWCSKDDLWPVYHEVLEELKIRFDQNNLNIPFPQRDIHMITSTSSLS